MNDFDAAEFKKKLKKKIKKQTKGRNIQVKTGGGFYFLGFVGSAIYYVSTAADFWAGVVGILKAIIWPAFWAYAALKGLNA